MKRAITACLCLYASATFAGTTVVPFGKLSVIAGTLLVQAQGTWAVTSDIQGAYAKTFDPGPINYSDIVCYIKERTCFESNGLVNEEGYLKSWLVRYEVTKWTNYEIRAESVLNCQITELSFSPQTLEATKLIHNGGYNYQNECGTMKERLSAPIEMKLMSPDAAAKYWREKRK